MTDDDVAAVVAAAYIVLERRRPAIRASVSARWGLAARANIIDAADARRVAGARSRWSQLGRGA